MGEVSERPVVYSELPGPQHSFDYFDSLCGASGEAFTAWVRSRRLAADVTRHAANVLGDTAGCLRPPAPQRPSVAVQTLRYGNFDEE